MLENGFCEIDGVDPAEAKARLSSPPKDAAKPSSAKPSSQSTKRSKGGDSTKCQFCGRVDKTFSNNEALDLHFWKDCQMLTECEHCS